MKKKLKLKIPRVSIDWFPIVSGICAFIFYLLKVENLFLIFFFLTLLLSVLIHAVNMFRKRNLRKINDLIKLSISKGLAHVIDLNLETGKMGDVGELAANINKMLLEIKSVFWTIKESLFSTKINNSTLENMKLLMISYIQKVTNIGNVRVELDNICQKINIATSSTKEILSLIVDLANKTNEEAQAIKEASEAIEKLLSIILNVTEVTQRKQEKTAALKGVINEGGQKIENTCRIIEQLNAGTGKILKVIEIITDISETTNILSINAGIEAAHTGQAGKGFRVIADEIKKLVASSKKNAGEISIMLKEQVHNINLALEESNRSGQVFSRVDREVHDAIEAWNEISTSTVDMSKRAKFIQAATRKMLNITTEVKVSSDTIRQSVEKISNENTELDKTSTRTLDILEKVTVTNEEAQKSTMEILQQLNEMGQFVVNLNKSIDFFTLGRKILYLSPDISSKKEVIKQILHHDYEVYPFQDAAVVLSILKGFKNAIVLVDLDANFPGFDVKPFFKNITKMKDVKVAFLSSSPGSPAFLESFDNHRYTIIPDHGSMESNLQSLYKFFNLHNSRGLRKHLRIECDETDNYSVKFSAGNTSYEGIFTDISSAAGLCKLKDSTNPGDLKKKFSITVSRDKKPFTIPCRSGIMKDNGLFLVNFDPRMDPSVRERIFNFIYYKLQYNMASEIRRLSEK